MSAADGRVLDLGARWGEWVGRRPHLVQAFALLALTVMFGYILFRLFQTREGANPISFVLLFGAETMSFIATALHFYETWAVPRVPTPEPMEIAADIVITTYNEPLTVLEPTIVGSLRVHGVGRVWVLDDGRRDEVREFCEKVGAGYISRTDNAHAKAGNINNALPQLDADYVLLLDADHVPSRHVIERMSGYFRDPEVALVQSPHNFRNLDSVQHRTPTRHEQTLFFRVLQPARDRNEASFWCGSSALLRRDALAEIGGVATETVSEDLHTTVRLQQRGYRARYHNEVLATGLAPHTIADFLLQRYRWAQGTMQVLLAPESPLFGRGWSWRQRLHYVNNLIYYLLPFQRLIYALVLVFVLLFAWLPVGGVSLTFLVLLGLSVVLTNLASLGLARGTRDASEGVAYTWITAETHMRAVIMTLLRQTVPFRVTPKSVNALDLREKLVLLRLPLLTILVILVCWFLRAGQEVMGALPFGLQLPGELDQVALAVVTAFVILEVLTVLPAVVRELRRTQRRALWRFTVHLDGRALGEDIVVTDIHESGVSLVGTPDLVSVGDELPFDLVTPPGTDVPPMSGVMTVRRVIDTGPHAVYGGPVRWMSADDRFSVLDLCYAHLAHDQNHS